MTQTKLESYLQQAAFEQTLTRLYGAEGAEKARSRCMEVMEEFYKTFDRPAEALFSAPGRTEIGGNHTDHQKGCVLADLGQLHRRAAPLPEKLVEHGPHQHLIGSGRTQTAALGDGGGHVHIQSPLPQITAHGAHAGRYAPDQRR